MLQELVTSFLTYNGYLRTGQVLEAAVSAFQASRGLEPTGSYTDPKTLSELTAPRCGLPDHMLQTEEAVWRKRTLKVHIKKYLASIAKDDMERIVLESFTNWGPKHAAFSASLVGLESEADIIVQASSNVGLGLGSPGRVLAVAELPPGDDRTLQMWIDEAESWKVDPSQRGISLLATVCHEAGHNLGLVHSQYNTALMFPTLGPWEEPQQRDDIPRIVAGYGPVVAPPPPPPVGAYEAVVVLKGAVKTKVASDRPFERVEATGWRCTRMGG